MLALSLGLHGCRDTARYSSHGDHYEGEIVNASFVRAQFGEGLRMCLVLDAEHLQSTPGTISSSDGRFQATPLRPIPQIWHDPLSTLSFGEGRRQNFVYVASPVSSSGTAEDVMVFLSLMASGDVEVRLVRGAPQTDAAATASSPMFGIFPLVRTEGACSF